MVRRRWMAASGAAIVLIALGIAASNLQLGLANLNTVAKKGDAKQRDSVTIDFSPIKSSKIKELAAKFDIVMGYTPEL